MSETTYKDIKHSVMQELFFVSSKGAVLFIYPFVGRSKSVLFAYVFTNFLVLFTATQLLLTIFHADSNWIEIVNVLPNLGVVLMTTLKYIKIHTNQTVYKKIFDHFRDDLWDVVYDSKEHKAIVAKYMLTTKYVTRFLFYFCTGLAIFVNFIPRIMMYLEKIITGEVSELLYPFDGWYPFDKITWYYTVYIWESFMTSVVVAIYAYGNIINTSYTLFMCLELKILGNSIERLVTPDEVRVIAKNLVAKRRDVNIDENIQKRLRNILKRHQFLKQITAEFDEVLGDGMFCNYIFGSIFLTLPIFTALVVDNYYKRMRYFFMFCSLLLENFYISMNGQILSDHSEELGQAIYSADWIYADIKTKKTLLFLMRRTQKPFQYTANGYLTLNLKSFTGICRMSYTVFNLLYTCYFKRNI